MKDLADASDLIYNYKQLIIIIINVLGYLYLIILLVYTDINALKTIWPYNKLRKIFIIINIFTIISVIISQ